MTRKSKRKVKCLLENLDHSPAGEEPSSVTIRDIVVDEDEGASRRLSRLSGRGINDPEEPARD